MGIAGRFQIKRISPEGATTTYQISLETFEGSVFVGSVEAEHLEHFLRERLRLKEESVEALTAELRSRGHVIVPSLELSQSDMAAAGMNYLSPAV